MHQPRHTDQSVVDDSFERAAALGGLNLRIRSKSFRSGRVTALLSGITVDLRDAELSRAGAELSVQSALSGIEVLVPASWHVVCEVDPIFGRVDGDRPRPAESKSPTPALRITGTVVAGGLHVR